MCMAFVGSASSPTTRKRWRTSSLDAARIWYGAVVEDRPRHGGFERTWYHGEVYQQDQHPQQRMMGCRRAFLACQVLQNMQQRRQQRSGRMRMSAGALNDPDDEPWNNVVSPYAVIRGIANSSAAVKSVKPVKALKNKARPPAPLSPRRLHAAPRIASRQATTPSAREATPRKSKSKSESKTSAGVQKDKAHRHVVRTHKRGNGSENVHLRNKASVSPSPLSARSSEKMCGECGDRGAAADELDRMIELTLGQLRTSNKALARRWHSRTQRDGFVSNPSARDAFAVLLDLAYVSGDILSANEERYLGQKIQMLRDWEAVLRRDGRLASPDERARSDVWQYWMRLVKYEGSLETFRSNVRDMRLARQIMVERNLRLILWVISKYEKRVNCDLFMDLFQEGVAGLMKAIEMFDWNLNYRFGTYAVWYIRQRVQVSDVLQVAAHGSPFRLPYYAYRLLDKMRCYRREREFFDGCYPSAKEIGDVLASKKKSWCHSSSAHSAA